jgi:hypothetical protein
VIAEFIEEETPAGPLATLTAKAFAASVVSVVNHALDVWASEDDVDAPAVLEAGLQSIGTRFGSLPPDTGWGAHVSGKGDLVIFVPGSDALREQILRVIAAPGPPQAQ